MVDVSEADRVPVTLHLAFNTNVVAGRGRENWEVYF